MKKPLIRISDRSIALILGVGLFIFDILALIFWFIFDPSTAVKIVSMISASHIGGRLAFIGAGLEFHFPVFILILIIFLYNTMYLLLVYSLIVFLWEQTKRMKLLHRFMESLKDRAEKKTQSAKKWSWLNIAFYIWIPLPWTGGLMGSLIAYITGYSTKQTLLIVIPSMWVGVASWTIWFNTLYGFIDKLGKENTLFFTFSIILFPLVFILIKKLVRRKT